MTPFLPRPVKELAGEVLEAPAWLVHGLLPKGTLALLAAYPKVGKSTLVAQLAVAVAQGRDFLGRQTHVGGVLVIVAEELKDDVMRRLRNCGVDEEADPIWLWTETVGDTPEDREKLRQLICDQSITLVIIDTLATYLMLKDETDNSSVTLRMKPYVDMAHESGAVILFVHHERKNRDEGDDDSRAIRGGGAILGLADVAFQLQKEGSGTKRRLKIVGRYQEIPRSLKLDYVDEGYVCLGTPEESSRLFQQAKALAVLPVEAPGLTVVETAAEAGMKDRAARTALDDARSAKKAERTGSGKKGDPFRYLRIATSLQDDRAPAAEEKEFAEV
jgi:predicted ATP-dependent serine protease